MYNIIYMPENNLKLWTCYPKNESSEKFNNIKSDDDDENDEVSISETYDNAIEDFSNINNSWKCVKADSLENFENQEASEEAYKVASDDEEPEVNFESNIKLVKRYFFGEDEYSDYYFYFSITLIVFILFLFLTRH
jgi:hypothetical protein